MTASNAHRPLCRRCHIYVSRHTTSVKVIRVVVPADILRITEDVLEPAFDFRLFRLYVLIDRIDQQAAAVWELLIERIDVLRREPFPDIKFIIAFVTTTTEAIVVVMFIVIVIEIGRASCRERV